MSAGGQGQGEPPRVDISDSAPEGGGKPAVPRAVALEYDEARDTAPRITATGKGAVAEQILALAFAHGVRVREDADLVEILSHLEVDSVIPLEAFTAVAEILSYVYRANAVYGKPPAHGAMQQEEAGNV